MLTNQKHKFSLPEDLTYFNVAYMSPSLKIAEVNGMEVLMRKSNPTLFGMEDFFDKVNHLKDSFGKIIHADGQQIAIAPSASYAMTNAANNITYKADGEIVVLSEQFPSNYYPWQKAAKKHNQSLRTISGGTEKENRVSQWNDNIISAINEKTTAVCMCHVHWADGSLYDLKAISAACQRHGAYLIIDGTQSVGALPLYLDDIKIDVLVAAAYKWLLGHYGMALAYYSPEFNQGNPIEDNWINKIDSEDFKNLVNYKEEYKPGAARYSVGEQSNFIHIAILQAGLEQIYEWGVENIQSYTRVLHQSLIDGLEDTDYYVPAIGQSSSHLTSIRISPEGDMEVIKNKLKENNIHVSYRGDAMRVSFYLFNDMAEVNKLINVLKSI